MAVANRHLVEQFVPAYNQRFAVSAAEPGTAFIPWVGTSLAEILCVQEDRGVAKDHTVRYQGLSLQIPPDRHRFPYVTVPVRGHEYPDGTLAVFHAPRCVARYDMEGPLIEPKAESGRQQDAPVRSRARPIADPRATVRERVSAPR